MKNLIVYLCRFGLVWSAYLVYFSLVTSCTPENNFRQNIEIILQIHLPNQDNLKSANSIAGIKSVTLTVTSEDNKILDEVELTISGNSATGIVKIEPGENIKFNAEAMDENNIIQWQGSTTVDIVDDFEVSIQLISIPPAVSNLQALFEEKSVTVSWSQNNDPDFARYNLYRSLSNNKFDTILHTTPVNSETEFMDNKVSEGRTYYYKLEVVDSEGFKTESVVDIKIPNSLPTQSLLKVDSINNKVMLSWTQNNDMDFARYDLYRSQSLNLLGTVIHSTPVITGTRFTDSSVSENNTYYYTLTVLDTDGFNTRSNNVQAVVPNLPPKASVLQGALDGSVYLNWTKNTDSDFAKYELYKSQSKNILGTIIYTTGDVTILDFQDSKVTEGNIYFYTLVVSDAKGLNTRSNIFQIDLIPPTASKLQIDTLNYNMFILSWTRNYDLDFNRYELYRSQKTGVLGEKIFSTNESAYTRFEDTKIYYYSTYFYTLIVFDNNGFSTESNVVEVNNGG